METVLITLRVTTRKDLKNLAIIEDRSVNGLINRAIKKYINESKHKYNLDDDFEGVAV